MTEEKIEVLMVKVADELAKVVPKHKICQHGRSNR